MLLETYTTLSSEELKQRMPDFLNIGSEVTGDPAFSMFNLSLKEEWVNNKKFCHRLSEEDGLGSIELTQKAKDRLDANKSRQSSPTGNGNGVEQKMASASNGTTNEHGGSENNKMIPVK
jgi:hypothetical protein